jgi:hypothetical protein
MRAPLVAASVLVCGLTAGVARAQVNPAEWEAISAPTGKATRRLDLTLGVGAGLDVGRARGYPNDLEKIDNPDYVADTRNTLGGGGSAWIGVAFTDWLTFALGATSINLASSELSGKGAGFFCRAETFPFFPLGGVGEDIGLAGNFGLGLLTIDKNGEKRADGGTLSMISGGAFYEAWHWGPLAVGPMVEYTHLWSLSAKLSSTLYGARIALYTGPN